MREKKQKGRKLRRDQHKDFFPTLLSIILWVTSMAMSMAVQRCTLTPHLHLFREVLLGK